MPRRALGLLRYSPLRLLPLMLAALLLSAGGGSVLPPAVYATQRTPAEALARPRQLELNGEWEAAEQAYRTAQGEGGEVGETARLELARLLERLSRLTDAADLLRPLTEAAPTGERSTRAWFQYGSVLQGLGRNDESIAAYRRYIELRGPAAAYARVETAKMQVNADQKPAAMEAIAGLLGGSGPEHARRVALRVAAPLAEELGRAQAADYYRAFAALTPVPAERIPALWKAATLDRARGNTAGAIESYRTLVVSYPYSQEAEDALGGLAELGRPASALETAFVHYRRENNTRARELYNQILNSNASAMDRAAAAFYLGALAERRGEPGLAAENYTESYNLSGDGPLAAASLWWRGVTLQEIDDAAEAQASYARLVERFPASSFAPRAAQRTGMIAYQAGRPAEARELWGACSTSSRGQIASVCALWSGKIANDTGDSAAARAAFGIAAERDPGGYYGLRAAAHLANQPQAPRHAPATMRQSAPNWAAAEAWLAGWAGAEGGAWQELQGTEEWQSAVELAQAGWDRVAMEVFGAITRRRQDQPWLVYRLGRALVEMGMPRFGISAAETLAEKAPAGSTLPAAIQTLAYPTPWPDLVQRFADQRGVDPLLLYALMKQESLFDPAAGSSAGAFGLTQFVEPTADEVADALDKSGFRFGDLVRPVLAIEFGAYYLNAQIRAQHSIVARGLAAYNAGGGSANRWARAAGSDADIDRFHAAIDFSETELYLRIVTENYAHYRALYGGAEGPSVVR